MAKFNIIKDLRAKKKLSQEELAAALGISREMVNKMENNKVGVSAKTKILILEKYHIDYVNEISHEADDVKNTMAEENSESYLQKRRKIKQGKSDAYMVPLLPVKAQAGYVTAMDQEMFVDTMEKYALPPGVNPQGAVWRYWEIEGDSMEPEYREGDVLLTSQVPYEDWENLRNFYAYVIVTNEKVLFKRIFCKNALEWVLISENEEGYPQQLLPVEFIREVWVVRRVVKNKLPPIKMFEIKV